MKDLKVLGAYDLERPLWVESGHSCRPLPVRIFLSLQIPLCTHYLKGWASSRGDGSTSAPADILELGIDSLDISQELVQLLNGLLPARRI